MNKETPKITFSEKSKEAQVTFKQILGSFVEPKLEEVATFYRFEVMRGMGFQALHKVETTNAAKIHGLDCFETRSTYINHNDDNEYDVISFDRIYKGHVQSLAYIETYPNGKREFYSFKDEHFLEHWAVGENNCGMRIHLKNEGKIKTTGNQLIADCDEAGIYDLVGTYELTINDQTYEVVRLVLLSAENQVSDFFIDNNGKEVMHRFFIPDNGFNDAQKDNPFSVQFPDAETILVNDRKCICTAVIVESRYL